MLEQASDFIKKKINNEYRPEIAVILGSGLGAFADDIKNPIKIKYHEIPAFKQSSIDGHAGQLVTGKIFNKDILVMQGRIHFYEGYSLKDTVFPIKVMKKLGIKKLVITNAAGAVNSDFEVGRLMFITDHINLMGTNPLIGKNDNELGTRFPDMSEVYDKNLLDYAKNCAKNLGINCHEGVYAAISGPTYETPAEVRMLQIIGADAIGMSTVPEAIVASYCGMKVLGISCLTNYAAGIKNVKLSHKEVIDTSLKVQNDFCSLLKEIIKNL